MQSIASSGFNSLFQNMFFVLLLFLAFLPSYCKNYRCFAWSKDSMQWKKLSTQGTLSR